MKKVREVIVVEGRYDKNTLAQIVDATIIPVGGFSIFHDREKLELLRTLAEAKGVIVLTDGDGAGFMIRNYLKGSLPKGRILQAYIPDVYGKEHRKRKPGKEGKLGVEGMKPEILLKALERAGATFEEGAVTREGQSSITKADLFAAGLSGQPDSAQRRAELQKKLSLPEHLSTNALVEVLNILFKRDEFLNYLSDTAK